jgi:hypothetical protein
VLYPHVAFLLFLFLCSCSWIIPFRLRLSSLLNTAFSFAVKQLTCAQLSLNRAQWITVATAHGAVWFFTYKNNVNSKLPPTCPAFKLSNFWPDFWTHSTFAAGNTPLLGFNSKLLLQCCSSPCSLASNYRQNTGFFPVLFLSLYCVIGLIAGNNF